MFLTSSLLGFYPEIAIREEKSVFNNMVNIAYKKFKKTQKKSKKPITL